MAYGWPVKPFDEQHAVRGFFCDPRIGAKGSKAFHFGIDISAPDGTPVYAVAGGTVHSEGAQNVGVITAAGRSHGYWHIVKRVRHGQRVRKGQLLGHVARTWGHVHFAERIDRHYWNPLREGALTPFRDFGAPVIDVIRTERGGRPLPPGALTGLVNLIVVAHDNPPISAPPPWRGMPVAPALIRWRLVRDGRAVIPWRVAVDFRTVLRTEFRYHEIYAGGTRQNKPPAKGRYRYWLARGWDTRLLRDGRYRLDVEAAYIRGNATRRNLELVLLNDEV
jgi:Peptidase family M23